MSARSISEFNRWFYGPHRRPRRSAITKRVRQKVYARDGHACQHCGATDDLSLDHIIPWSKGGTHAQANLQVLCRTCNHSKADS